MHHLIHCIQSILQPYYLQCFLHLESTGEAIRTLWVLSAAVVSLKRDSAAGFLVVFMPDKEVTLLGEEDYSHILK